MYFVPPSWVAYWLNIVMVWFSFFIFMAGQLHLFDEVKVSGRRLYVDNVHFTEEVYRCLNSELLASIFGEAT